MKNKILMAVAMLFALLLTGCENSEVIKDITISELTEILKDDYQFVDVRTNEEYITNHIQEFDINIDYYIFSENISLLNTLEKNKPVVLMCRSGNRSSQAAQILEKEGFSSIYNILGGMTEWNNG